MYLKRLELSGFKSFAKHSVLEFLNPVTAVVGPNGSGKSNVAEAIQWVLGEQSLKSLRGKRGEDLIFAGSVSSPRLGRAAVSMTFDNKKKHFDVDFDEVVIERRVYRDGSNEYLLNGSKVRLKDIIGILSNVGLGSSQHHIISQGESDRILYASPKDRRGMIEDALGIKIYQLKRHEAERKLESTENNMKQVASLRREIQPHLKFLRQQAEKIARSKEIRESLKEKLTEYFGRESAQIAKEQQTIESQKAGPQKLLKEKESEITALKDKLNREEKSIKDRAELDKKLEDLKNELNSVQSKRSQLERDLGRVEGKIEAQKQIASQTDVLSASPEEIKKFLSETERMLSDAINNDVLERVREILKSILSSLALLTESRQPIKKHDIGEAINEKNKIAEDLSFLIKKESALSNESQKLLSSIQESAKNLRGVERSLYEMELGASKLRDELRTIEFNEEKLRLRKEDFNRDSEESRHYLEGAEYKKYEELFDSAERELLKKEIERMKIKLEEAGGVDPSVAKEFKDVSDRDEFFERELQDLGEAAVNLRKVIKDLEEKLENDFNIGIQKINKEFQKFFETMFGGGRAGLRVIKPKRKKRQASDEDYISEDNSADDSDESKETGIDVFIDLPRKRIKSLDMLSGGERALSSIALLFALSAVNPPPFLVLDETDAALDEANSRRYGAMLDTLAKNTQLIVITHNKVTIEHASIMYGITMQETGVSRLVSVKLTDDNLHQLTDLEGYHKDFLKLFGFGFDGVDYQADVQLDRKLLSVST